MWPFLVSGAVMVLAGLVVRALLATRGRDPRRAWRYVRAWLAPRRSLDVARILLAWTVASWAYFWLKLFVPVLNPRSWDADFARWDAVLHLGLNPNRFAIELFPYPAVWRLVGGVYGAFVAILVALFGWCVSTLRVRERARFALGFSAMWLAGAWLYLAFPAVGPCYAFPDDFARVRPALGGNAELQRTLITQYAKIRARRLGRGDQLNPGYGVAAMPSLHVGALVFFALWAKRESRTLAACVAIVAAFVFFGSLVTGWHYAIDGYVGALLAWACVALAGRAGAPLRQKNVESVLR